MNDRLIDLARRARDGGESEMEALLNASAGVVHAIARAQLGDTAAAEAATADALASIARGLAGLRDPRAFPKWLHRVTLRCAAKLVISRRGSADPVSELADPGGGPVELLVATERQQMLRDAVAELPERMRQPVLLHFVEGMTYRDIATTLGTGLGSVVRRMNEALSRLERELGDRP